MFYVRQVHSTMAYLVGIILFVTSHPKYAQIYLFNDIKWIGVFGTFLPDNKVRYYLKTNTKLGIILKLTSLW